MDIDQLVDIFVSVLTDGGLDEEEREDMVEDFRARLEEDERLVGGDEDPDLDDPV